MIIRTIIFYISIKVLTKYNIKSKLKKKIMYIKSMMKNIVELILKNISKINKDIDQLS